MRVCKHDRIADKTDKSLLHRSMVLDDMYAITMFLSFIKQNIAVSIWKFHAASVNLFVYFL